MEDGGLEDRGWRFGGLRIESFLIYGILMTHDRQLKT